MPAPRLLTLALLLGSGLLLLPSSPARAASDPAADAAAVVESVYRSHFANHQRWDETAQREKARFSANLRQRLEEDAAAAARNPDEVVGLDFDPLTNSQEEAAAFTVRAGRMEGAEAVVPVEVRMGGAARTIRVRLVREDGVWKIANIHYNEGDLLAILAKLKAERGR